MADIDKVFVILDPTTLEQSSLLMAESIAQRGTKAALHVYCSIHEKSIRAEAGVEPEQSHADARQRVADWIERLVAPSRALGLSVDTEVEISENWRAATVAAVARQDCQLAIKARSPLNRRRRLFREASDWQLLRDLVCPVYLVKTASARRPAKVLAAIKHRTEKQVYTEANELIIQTARGIATGFDAELHVVTAYKDDFHYPDRQKFADRCGLPRNQVRAEMGAPAEAIIKIAKEIGADLVVIARVGKQSTKRDVGHTAAKVIDTLDANLLVLPMTEST
ncbi:MAG TPA: universal stress protein [Gammaproteobacteria bacterium]|jgi:hypothetical protein|nr:hypothetical protein [Chromatiales bacterium]MCP4925228.1 universal stress protein [Gammaproteobacteria bacterium]MDP7660669.1 universal stress protein [Gammaproteobacteria bacterium]HJP38965.1 universal stress protein [Gammaproteobacteria bacterium]